MTSLEFSKNNKYLAAGLAENGTVKVWDLLNSKSLVKNFKPTAGMPKHSTTCVQYNKQNDFIGASSTSGHVYLYPIADLNSAEVKPSLLAQGESVKLTSMTASPVNHF